MSIEAGLRYQGFRGYGTKYGVNAKADRINALGLRIQAVWFMVQGLGCWVHDKHV